MYAKPKCLLNSQALIWEWLCLYFPALIQISNGKYFSCVSFPSVKWGQDMLLVKRITRIKISSVLSCDELLYVLWLTEENNPILQVIFGPFTHEIHNIMFNTSTGSFLFGVVMALRVTLSLVQVWWTKTISYLLTDSCPKALDICAVLHLWVTWCSWKSQITNPQQFNFAFCCFFSCRTLILHL